MAIDRRRFLIGAGAALGAALAPRRGSAGSPSAASLVYVGACADAAGGYWVAGFDKAGALRFATALPGRGHDILLHPDGDELLIFARRPGLWFVRIGREKGPGATGDRLVRPSGLRRDGVPRAGRDGGARTRTA